MTGLIPFNFEHRELRTVRDSAGVAWFAAADVCNALGFSNPWKAVADHVDAEDLTKREALTTGGKQTATFVNESGLYALIFGSRLPQAKRFKRWVTNELLPRLRQGERSVGSFGPDMPYIAPRPPQLLTLRQISERTGFSTSALRTRLCRGNGPMPMFKVGKEWRADARDVDEWVWKMKNEGIAAMARPRVVQQKALPAPRRVVAGDESPTADPIAIEAQRSAQ